MNESPKWRRALGLFLGPIRAYWRWVNLRHQTARDKALALTAPILSLLVIIIIIASVAGGLGQDESDAQQVAGRPTQAEQPTEAPASATNTRPGTPTAPSSSAPQATSIRAASTAIPTETAVVPVGRGQLARVTRVIDGDTIEIEFEGRTLDVRYIGIDTPETVAPGQPVECFGPQASARNRELVGGRTVQLEKDVTETDRYGRLLRYVYVDGLMVNELLVAEGFAQVSTFPPDVKYADRFLNAQRRAMKQRLCLWGACAKGDAGPTPVVAPPPPGMPGKGAANVVVDPSCSQFNSPGNDNSTAVEEYVCLRNTGGDAAILTGSSISDFEARHTYVFPSFTLAAGAAVRLRSGCGANTASELYWCADGAVWNNDGDVVTLRDSAGNVWASYSYGSPS